MTGVGYSAYSSGAIDPLIAGLACQATNQLNILKDNLQFLNQYTNEHLSQNSKRHKFTKSELIFNKINNCVDYHQSIIEYNL